MTKSFSFAPLMRQIDATRRLVISRAIDHIQEGDTERGVKLLRQLHESLLDDDDDEPTKREPQTEREALDSAIASLLDSTPEEEEAWLVISTH